MTFELKEDETFEGNVKCEYNFTWRIEDFSKKADIIESKVFSLRPMCNSEWKIVLNMNVSDDCYSMNVGLKRTDNSPHVVSVKSYFTLRNTKGTPFVGRTLTASFSLNERSKFCESPIRKKPDQLFWKNDMGGQFRLCKDDILIVDGNVVPVPCCLQNEPMEKSVNSFHNSLFSSYKEKILTDFDIVVGEDVISTHKFILAAWSPVFRKMFENNMKENLENKINMTDVEKQIIEAFLSYIYTGTLTDSNIDTVIELYALADKYDVQTLQETCSHFLSLAITEDTACQILSLANIHNDKKLYDSAFQYLCDNFLSVRTTDEWQKFLIANIELAVRVVGKVAMNFS